MADKPTPKERKAATEALKDLHSPIFRALGIQDPAYIPKMAYQPTDLQGLHMGFFESELDHGQDVYTEKVSMALEPEDDDRTLYKWRFNPHYKTEYATSEPMSNGHVRYFIPMDEMEIITMPTEAEIAAKEFNLIDPERDAPIDQLTCRDVAALLLKKPVSSKSWINELIES